MPFAGTDRPKRRNRAALVVGCASVMLVSSSCSLGTMLLDGLRRDGARSTGEAHACPSDVPPLVDAGGAVLSALAVAFLVENDCTKPNAPLLCTRNVDVGTWVFGGAAVLFAVSAGVGFHQHATCNQARSPAQPEREPAADVTGAYW